MMITPLLPRMNKRNNFHISPHRFQPPRKKPLYKSIIVRVLCGAALIIYLTFAMSSRTQDIENPFDLPNVEYYELESSKGTNRGWERDEQVLMCVPLRDAEPHIPMFFSHLKKMTYPHKLIDIAFLVSDSKDDTLGKLLEALDELQSSELAFGEISVIEKDFGQAIGQSFSDRHAVEAQASRRKLMAKARNWLLTNTLKAQYSWVYWRDADVESIPPTILEDLMHHDKDVIVPNVWRPLPDWLGGEQPYDLNSWQESETALQLAATLHEDDVIVEGYAEYATWRPHLAYLRDPYGDPETVMDLDGIGGVSILSRAQVFRHGANFPAFSYKRHAETEGFGKMCRDMKFSVSGKPHYVIWHLYEPSLDDLKIMEEMRRTQMFRDQWELDKLGISEMEGLLKEGKEEVGELVGGEAGPIARAGGDEVGENGMVLVHDAHMQRPSTLT